jgi:hypothetical protein
MFSAIIELFIIIPRSNIHAISNFLHNFPSTDNTLIYEQTYRHVVIWKLNNKKTNNEYREIRNYFCSIFSVVTFLQYIFHSLFLLVADKRKQGMRDSQISIAHFAIANWIKEIALQNNTSSIKFFTNYLLEAIYKGKQARLSLTVFFRISWKW